MITPRTALHVVNHIPAMVAYWGANERCEFANGAYRYWFGRTTEQMDGITLEQLLGPLYEKNLPFIRGALGGARQVFERRIPLPNGDARDTIATYTPEIVGGRVTGFSAHVADVTLLRRREAELAQALRDSILVLENSKRSFRSKELGLLRQQLVALEESRTLPAAHICMRDDLSGKP